jgi:uncharacterized small protein (DUF1192 family)
MTTSSKMTNNFIFDTSRASITSPSSNNSNDFQKSFEKLLNEPNVNFNSTSGFNLAETQTLLSQIGQLKTDLIKSKKQLEHLNDLLNETELNNVRLSEQITVLKDEIRRLERNQEREKSISNMEYLKNVVLKFLTFSSQQEKAQLLPVLTTMLRLSQDEQNAIMSAKLLNNVQVETAGGVAAGSWASFLPKWSS